MSLRTHTRLLLLLATMTALTTLLHANAISGSIQISGSLPLAGFGVTLNGSDLLTATTVKAANAVTTDAGKGDFSMIPMMTSFGRFSLTDTTVSTGGGFSISNPGYGKFVASGGSIIGPETATSLVVDMTGTYTPGPLFVGLTAAPAEATIASTFNGGSTSVSLTLVTTTGDQPDLAPEPATILTLGMGLCAAALALHRKRRHE